MPDQTGMGTREFRRGLSSVVRWTAALTLMLAPGLSGCGHALPIVATFRGDAGIRADATVKGTVDVKLPAAIDPGEMTAEIVRPGRAPAPCARVALIDVDGVLLNQNPGGNLYAVGDNPLGAFHEKLDAAANDPQVVAVLLRINSPGGSVTACDVMADELRRFRARTGKPTVAFLMDLATSGACLLAAECDRIIACPTTLTGGLGVVFNHFNLQDAMGQLNITTDSIKSGAKIDMGTVTAPLDEDTRAMFQQMADAYRDHLQRRAFARRPAMTEQDRRAFEDGRVVLASQALEHRLVDRLGYLDDAIDEAERSAGTGDGGAEVVLYHRTGQPAHSVYAVKPASTPLSEAVPFSYPGLDRSRLPTFLYLWQPDPTLPRPGAR